MDNENRSTFWRGIPEPSRPELRIVDGIPDVYRTPSPLTSPRAQERAGQGENQFSTSHYYMNRNKLQEKKRKRQNLIEISCPWPFRRSFGKAYSHRRHGKNSNSDVSDWISDSRPYLTSLRLDPTFRHRGKGFSMFGNTSRNPSIDTSTDDDELKICDINNNNVLLSGIDSTTDDEDFKSVKYFDKWPQRRNNTFMPSAFERSGALKDLYHRDDPMDVSHHQLSSGSSDLIEDIESPEQENLLREMGSLKEQLKLAEFRLLLEQDTRKQILHFREQERRKAQKDREWLRDQVQKLKTEKDNRREQQELLFREFVDDLERKHKLEVERFLAKQRTAEMQGLRHRLSGLNLSTPKNTGPELSDIGDKSIHPPEGIPNPGSSKENPSREIPEENTPKPSRLAALSPAADRTKSHSSPSRETRSQKANTKPELDSQIKYNSRSLEFIHHSQQPDDAVSHTGIQEIRDAGGTDSSLSCTSDEELIEIRGEKLINDLTLSSSSTETIPLSKKDDPSHVTHKSNDSPVRSPGETVASTVDYNLRQDNQTHPSHGESSQHQNLKTDNTVIVAPTSEGRHDFSETTSQGSTNTYVSSSSRKSSPHKVSVKK